MRAQFPEVFAISPPDKLRLLEELWDSLTADLQDAPLPAWQLDELQRRKAAHAKNPGTGLTSGQVRIKILGDHV